ncbi:MAG: TRAP transporter small permease subunit [Bacteroidales bacterium]|jgi:TRAP-type C4-dicarboxylate transport system permease small subunit|nr:TRAP transporter small permease subunit [Bacteroidales bacterium]
MRKIIDFILSRLVILVMTVLVTDVLLQVVAGIFISGSNPFSFTDELAEFLLIWVGLLGAAYVTGQKQHLAIELINSRLSEGNLIRMKLFINLLIIIFSLLVLLVGGTRFVIINIRLEQLSAAMQLPMWYVYLVLPLSGLFIIFYAIDDIVNLLKVGKSIK